MTIVCEDGKISAIAFGGDIGEEKKEVRMKRMCLERVEQNKDE